MVQAPIGKGEPVICNAAIEVGGPIDQLLEQNDFAGARSYLGDIGPDISGNQRRKFRLRIGAAEREHRGALAIADDPTTRAEYLRDVPFGD